MRLRGGQRRIARLILQTQGTLTPTVVSKSIVNEKKRMCLGVPAVITEVHGAAHATVEIGNVARIISADLLVDEDLAQGDWVLVHVGFAMSKIDEEEATLSLQQIKQLGGDTYGNELKSSPSSQISWG